MEIKLNPPIVDNKAPAQADYSNISIPFLMNKSVGWGDFTSMALTLKTVQSNVELITLFCTKESLILKNGNYWGTFVCPQEIGEKIFKVGQHYKAQLAYVSNGYTGFYSNVVTFKYTSKPTLSIQDLSIASTNTHLYDYIGVYENSDASEKVYSYCFDLKEASGNIVASSGEILHNSTLDTDTTMSIDRWATRYELKPGNAYTLTYKVKTVNGLECSSPGYSLIDKHLTPSNIFNYCTFKARNISDSACVELSLIPKDGVADRKFISGKFVLLRASNEDNFDSWYELTRFVLSSHDTQTEKIICRDYCVSQGVTYKYALQAYNNNKLYSLKEIANPVFIDFEDMFLSDGKRQLRIKFNPKVSSFKKTLLEAKMDTLGGKYPFFFRNGRVGYKEFPISGLISMLMDEEEEFMVGIQLDQVSRTRTPSLGGHSTDLPTALTGDNFRREREFKMEVLEWLTNGQPKHFRSPGEGSFIVRLMNTSLTPTDSLSRMLHTFNCTAYEIADYTFENLRKYGMMMEENLNTEYLKFHSVDLDAVGSASNLNASMATLHASAGTEFRFKLKNSSDEWVNAFVGDTNVFNFSQEVLAENPLMSITFPEGKDKNNWLPQSTLIYATYIEDESIDTEFSGLQSIDVVDQIAQWIGGSNDCEIAAHLDKNQILKNIGLIYYLKIEKRHIRHDITKVQWNGTSYEFYIGEVERTPGHDEIIYFDEDYYDGKTKQKITEPLNFEFQLRHSGPVIDLMGVNIGAGIGQLTGCDAITDTGGRIVLTNVSNVDYLHIGNGLYVDIAYQEINKTYTIESVTGHPVQMAKQTWMQSGTDAAWQHYYNLLSSYIIAQEEDLIINAL